VLADSNNKNTTVIPMYSCIRCDSLVTFDPYGDPHCRCNNIEGPMKTALQWALLIALGALLDWLIVFHWLPRDMPL
jgi:hypothetical protein